MRLIKKMRQSRRDFTGLYKCEGCGSEEGIPGYDDRNFHDVVIPDTKCGNCHKSTNDLGQKPQSVATKYPKGQVV